MSFRGNSVICSISLLSFILNEIWGCAKVYGRGTLYMKWGQENLRFATMRLRGEKRKREKRENRIK